MSWITDNNFLNIRHANGSRESKEPEEETYEIEKEEDEEQVRQRE